MLRLDLDLYMVFLDDTWCFLFVDLIGWTKSTKVLGGLQFFLQ